MSPEYDKVDILSRLSIFHEDVSALQNHIRQVLTLLGNGHLHHASKYFHGFYRNSLVYHFAFEENVVFPAILAWGQKVEFAELISGYEELHRNLIQEGTVISELLESGEENSEAISVHQIAESLAQLCGNLQRHAQHENSHIIPLLEKNSSLRFLTGRNYYLFKNEAQKYFYDTP